MSMKPPLDPEQALGWYRTAFLKLQSVLHDQVTALPAMPALLERLRSDLDRRRHLGVLHIEIDDLAMVESLYGWQVFDRILERAASTLRESLGSQLPKDSLLSVNGVAGDCFVAFVPAKPDGSEVDGAFLAKVGRAVALRLDKVITGPEFAGLFPRLSTRCGHALLSQDPFHRFERRVYAAVQEAAQLDKQREQRRELSWSEELRRIIRDASLHTVFQPVVDMRTRAVLGHEALTRGPVDSLFEMPSVMFAMSNRVGLASALDRVCREVAVRASAKMVDKGKLFLNVLPGSLVDEAHRDVQELARQASLDPRDLVLEFSERAADPDPDAFASTMSSLKKQGFSVALDDVGTGRGSRELIERIGPHYLKLDVSLVRDIHENLIKQELLRTLLQMARQIDAAVIAEGVECEEEAAVLMQAGTQFGQGYLFAAPAAPTWPGSGGPEH